MVKIDYIKAWALSLSFCSISSLIIYFLVPKGSFEKPMKTVIAIFLLSGIISPIFRLRGFEINDTDFFADDFSSQMGIEIDNFEENAGLEFSNILKTVLLEAIKKEGLSVGDIEIITKKNDMGQIYVDEIIISIKAEKAADREKIIKIVEQESGLRPVIDITN